MTTVKSELTVKRIICGKEHTFNFFWVCGGVNRPITTEDLKQLKAMYKPYGGLKKFINALVNKNKTLAFEYEICLLHPETGEVIAELNPFSVDNSRILPYVISDARLLHYAKQMHIDKATVAMLMGR